MNPQPETTDQAPVAEFWNPTGPAQHDRSPWPCDSRT
jgi:hypothetical protein